MWSWNYSKVIFSHFEQQWRYNSHLFSELLQKLLRSRLTLYLEPLLSKVTPGEKRQYRLCLSYSKWFTHILGTFGTCLCINPVTPAPYSYSLGNLLHMKVTMYMWFWNYSKVIFSHFEQQWRCNSQLLNELLQTLLRSRLTLYLEPLLSKITPCEKSK